MNIIIASVVCLLIRNINITCKLFLIKFFQLSESKFTVWKNWTNWKIPSKRNCSGRFRNLYWEKVAYWLFKILLKLFSLKPKWLVLFILSIRLWNIFKL